MRICPRLKIWYTVGIIALASVSASYADSAASSVRKGTTLYHAGRYDEAIEMYQKALGKKPDSNVILYDLGAVYYKKKKLAKAEDCFTRALITTDKEFEEKVNYNLGNVKYRQCEQAEEDDVRTAVGHCEKAIQHYKRAIELDPKDKDARYNLDVAEKKLKDLNDSNKPRKKQKTDEQNKDKQQRGKQQKGQGQEGQDQRTGEQESKDKQKQDQNKENKSEKDQQGGGKNQPSQTEEKKEKEAEQKGQGENKQGKEEDQNKEQGKGDEQGNQDKGKQAQGSQNEEPKKTGQGNKPEQPEQKKEPDQQPQNNQEKKQPPVSPQGQSPQGKMGQASPQQGEGLNNSRQDQQSMSLNDAEMLLEGFRQEEEAKGEVKKTSPERRQEVEKNW
ncbi:MAG: tetratricopeptide repeat protein [Candidatus Omnitrophica bacterium]|nr:tetratricopeptide repeat protein [Candidatus Omnitrophota bacterium]